MPDEREPVRKARLDYDQALKAAISQSPDGFLALIAPDMRWYGELSPELPSVARQADLVWDVASADNERGILHIELQTKVEQNIGRRMAEYALRLHVRDDRPVYSAVVFLRPESDLPQPPFVFSWAGQARLMFVYDVIRLWELPPELVLGTTYYNLWPLAGLMAGASVESVLATAERIAEAPLQRHQRSELTGLLALLAGMRLPKQAILNAIERDSMIHDIWKESSFAEAAYEIFHDELVAKGKTEGERELARVALEGRFGTLSEDMLAAIATADQETCRDIVAHLTTDTREEARARLGLS